MKRCRLLLSLLVGMFLISSCASASDVYFEASPDVYLVEPAGGPERLDTPGEEPVEGDPIRDETPAQTVVQDPQGESKESEDDSDGWVENWSTEWEDHWDEDESKYYEGPWNEPREESKKEPAAGSQQPQTVKPQTEQKKPTQSQKLPAVTVPATNDNSVDALLGVNRLRPDYNLGICQNLSGEVSVLLFYMDDYQGTWTADKIDKFTNQEVGPGLVFLELYATKYGVDLDLNIKGVYSGIFYSGEVVVDTRGVGYSTNDALDQAARQLNWSTDDEMVESFINQYGTEVVCITIFDKKGTAYAINPPRGSSSKVQEHVVLFTMDLESGGKDPVGSQSSVTAHEVLHLYGAEDFYITSGRKELAKKHYPADIMLGANYYIGTNNITPATAFYVGWTDNAPNVLSEAGWNE